MIRKLGAEIRDFYLRAFFGSILTLPKLRPDKFAVLLLHRRARAEGRKAAHPDG